MEIQQLKNRIREFWHWFEQNEAGFRNITDPHFVREQLDNMVLPFGKFSWEIGEGDNKLPSEQAGKHTFTISPNGNEQLLKISEAIIGEAPNLSQWEFYPAKPARNWDFMIEVYDDFLIKRSVDSSTWKYMLRMTPQRKIRILLHAPQFNFVDEEDRLSAAQLVINNCIGEMDKIYFVEAVIFMPPPDEALLPELHAMPELRAEFEQLVEQMF